MQIYRFSPIETEQQFMAALEYVADNVGKLALKLSGDKVQVPILKLFAHYSSEYKLIEAIVNKHGQRSKVSSANSFYVDVDSGISIDNTQLTLLGVRRPDAYRMQVGCGDFVTENFEEFTAKILQDQPEFARPVNNSQGLSMVELWHPDFDVLGYIVPTEE